MRTVETGFIKAASVKSGLVESWDEYPYSIPAVRRLGTLKLHPKVTYFVGENGSGKSTLVEAIAVASGMNSEGGSKNFAFATRNTVSPLSGVLQLARGVRRERTAYFLRAESLYNVATEIEHLDSDEDNAKAGPPVVRSYGGMSLHEQSHGESFLSVMQHRFGSNGLYILDEPEAALSVSRQFAFLRMLDRQVQRLGSQFIISTHSPILLAYPDSTIYRLDEGGIRKIAYEEAESYQSTLDFLNNREVYLRELLPEYFDGRDP